MNAYMLNPTAEDVAKKATHLASARLVIMPESVMIREEFQAAIFRSHDITTENPEALAVSWVRERAGLSYPCTFDAATLEADTLRAATNLLSAHLAR